MTIHGPFLDAGIWINGYDFSGDHNAVSLELSRAVQSDARFGYVSKSNVAAQHLIRFSGAGLWQAGADTVDPVLFAAAAASPVPVAIVPDRTEGQVSYTFAVKTRYQLGGAVGELLPFEVGGETGAAIRETGVSATYADPARRGLLLLDRDLTLGVGNGTAFELGAIASGQSLYAILHHMGPDEASTFTIQSDALEAFGSPATQVNWSAGYAAHSVVLAVVAGPVTDSWWRATWNAADDDEVAIFAAIA